MNAVELAKQTTCTQSAIWGDEAAACAGTAACTKAGEPAVCDAQQPASEVCDGVDNNCDGQTDEGLCNDDKACTASVCAGAQGCQTKDLATGTTCDADGSACTVGDACKEGVCLPGTATTCDDNSPCTVDNCDKSSGKCVYNAKPKEGAKCDADGSACTVEDACKGGKCAPGAAKLCKDGNVCTDDSCAPKSGCQFKANTAACSDDDACTSGDKCKSASCVAGVKKKCDDSETCTHDKCDAKTGSCGVDPILTQWLNGTACDDGDVCTEKDSCKDQKCVPGKAKSCADGKVCTDDSCNSKAGCQFKNNAASCDDDDACTGEDICTSGSCVGAKFSCDDGSVCTTDSCDKGKGCVSTPLKDGVACDSFAGSGTCGSGKCVVKTTVPVGAAKDYAFWHWPGNHRPTETWPKVLQVMHFFTGYYGLAFESSTGKIKRFGPVKGAPGYRAARLAGNGIINGMPSADLRFEAGGSSAGIVATTFLGASNYTVDRTRMIDGGRLMNRVYVPTVRYAKDSGLAGEVQIASMARHVVWTHTVKGNSAAGKIARISLGGAALSPYKYVKWLVPKRALQLTNAKGDGWVFIVADDKQHTLTLTGAGAVVAQRSVNVAPSAGVKASLLVAPAHALTAEELALYLNPTKSVVVRYSLLNLQGKQVGATVNAPWDPTLGAFRVTLKPMTSTGAPAWANYEQAVYHNWYGRHRLEIVRGTDAKVSVPLAMHGPHKIAWYIVGGIPMWRDLKGNPLGLPLQISKNWHGQTWYHLYSQPTVAKKGTSGMELTVASSRWGKPYAVSHAQLSLVGWGNAGGHWDESAVGAFGESITYDPDLTLGRAMVDDVRPLLVLSSKKWNWTGNVGGADFLRYRDAKKWYWERRLSRVRSVYRAIGPNVTDVGYAGVSTDGAIQGDIRTQLVASDDMVRAYYHLNYTFLKDVDYHTLAFFQVAADNYADNGYTRYAYGDAKGKSFEAQVPAHSKTGYISNKDRGIAIKGSAPWVLLFKSTKTGDKLPERYANVGFVVRSYELKVGGKTITTPHINVTRTYNGKSPQMAFQLGVPHQTDAAWCGALCKGKQRFIPKGSTLKATVEYLVLPADKSRYYGASDHLKATPAAEFASYQLMRRVAAGNHLTVTTTAGKLLQAQPVEIQAAPAEVAADVTVNGGLSYTPLTFRGLKRHDGWQLQQLVAGKWKQPNLAVRGKDFGQANYDSISETWSLTFAVPNKGKQRYRLVYVSGS